MAFISSGYVDIAIGTNTRLALAATAGAFDQFERMARARVTAACQVAGYSLATSSSNDMLQYLTLGQWYVVAGGLRKGIEPPAAIADSLWQLDQVRKGDMPIPGLSPSQTNGIGGHVFTTTSTYSSNARVPRFTRNKLDKSWG